MLAIKVCDGLSSLLRKTSNVNIHSFVEILLSSVPILLTCMSLAYYFVHPDYYPFPHYCSHSI
jgi:hypothetical protein